MLAPARMASVQLVCLIVVVVVIFYYVARLTRMTQQQQQRSSLRDKLIQQRDEVARRLNDLQVNFYR